MRFHSLNIGKFYIEQSGMTIGSFDGRAVIKNTDDMWPSELDFISDDETGQFAVGINGSNNGSNSNDGYIWSYTYNDIRIGTNSNERMIVKADGKIGIGVSDPDYALDVNGDARVGWRGYSTKMYVSPYEIHFTGSSDLKSGGSLELLDGVDGWYSSYVPKGYKITGCYLMFQNGPDELILRSGSHSSDGSSTVHTFSSSDHNSSGPVLYDVSSFNGSDVTSDRYIYMRFENDSNHHVRFQGGYFKLTRE